MIHSIYPIFTIYWELDTKYIFIWLYAMYLGKWVSAIFCFLGKPWKNMENAFYFTYNAHLFLEIFKFLKIFLLKFSFFQNEIIMASSNGLHWSTTARFCLFIPPKTSENNLLSKYFRNSFVIHWLYFWLFAKGIELVSDAPLLHIFFPRTFSIINTRAID